MTMMEMYTDFRNLRSEVRGYKNEDMEELF